MNTKKLTFRTLCRITMMFALSLATVFNLSATYSGGVFTIHVPSGGNL